jgi:hypothetical protein
MKAIDMLRKRMRGVWVQVAVLYTALVAVGAVFLAASVPDPRAYVALKKLNANHRIVDGDIAEAGWPHRFLTPSLDTRYDFYGRYVDEKTCEDDPIGLTRNTRTGPDIKPEQDRWIVWIPLRDLPPADIAALDVYRTLDVCNLDDRNACGPLPVEAIACSSAGDEGSCTAAVRLTADQRKRFFEVSDRIANDKTYKGPRVHVLIRQQGAGHGMASPRPEPPDPSPSPGALDPPRTPCPKPSATPVGRKP